MKTALRIVLTLSLALLCVTRGALADGGGGGSSSSGSSSSSSASSSSSGGSASSSAHASAGSGSSATAVASATSQTFASSKSSIRVIVKKIFAVLGNADHTCAAGHLAIGVHVKDIGLAFAQAIADTANYVEVNGTSTSPGAATASALGIGNACSYSDATAKASASSVVGILAEIIAGITNRVSKAKAAAYLDVYSSVYATAFADAWSHACIEGEGSAYAYQNSVATAIARPLATIFVWIELGIDCTGKSGYASVYAGVLSDIHDDSSTSSTSGSGVDGSGSAGAGGSAGTTTGRVPPCLGLHSKCCAASGTKCYCGGSSRKKFCDLHRNGPREKVWWGPRDRPVCGCA